VSVVRRFLGRGKSRREKTAHPKPQIDTE